MNNQHCVQQLAPQFTKVYESSDPSTIFTYSPGIAYMPNGNIIATLDMSFPTSEVINISEDKVNSKSRRSTGKIFTSNDLGKSWTYRKDFPFKHARPFVTDNAVYLIGQNGDIMIMRSNDWGETWEDPVRLTEGQMWHQAPSNVHYAKGNVYLVMEKVVYGDMKGWPVSVMAPVLMRGKIQDDLCKKGNWTFASELVFRDVICEKELEYFGIPFFQAERNASKLLAPKRGLSPMGWLETNVVQFVDENHYFYDSEGHTFHLWMRAHTGSTGFAAIAKAIEQADGSILTMLETVPSGKKIVFVPCPGGQMKFHILYDQITKLYWLLSSQATDSMTRVENLPSDRYNLPNNERHRLQLHFSKNCIDWCFAGLVAKTDSPKEARHYASMVIVANDLFVLCRSGDERAVDAHNGNFISFHVIKNFRELVY